MWLDTLQTRWHRTCITILFWIIHAIEYCYMSHVPNILYLIECGGWLHRWVCNMYAPPFDIWCCSPNAQIKTYKWCARYVTKCRSSSMLKFKKCKKGDLRLSVGRKRKCTPFLHIGFQLNYRNYSDELHFIKRSGELSYHIFFEFLLNSTSGFLNCVQFFFSCIWSFYILC